MLHWIDTLNRRVTGIMADTRQQPLVSLAGVLHAMSVPYGRVVKWRREQYRRGRLVTRRLPCPVISIGNLEVGGTGKTPMTIYLARLIQDLGYRPAVISRGYKGTGSGAGAVVSDGRTIMLNADATGDEPYLMATSLDRVPVVIGRDRWAAGQLAIDRFQPHVLLLDDGFQHFRLHRDLDVVLLDAGHPFGNGHLLPRGRLREPVGALARSHAVVLTRSGTGEPAYFGALRQALYPRPLFRAEHRIRICGRVPAGEAIRRLETPAQPNHHLKNNGMFAFSGLARNHAFRDSLSGLGVTLNGSMDFDDHHGYDPGDLRRIVDNARRTNAIGLITTEKDYVRLPADHCLSLDLTVVGVNIDFAADRQRWRRFVYDLLHGWLGDSNVRARG